MVKKFEEFVNEGIITKTIKRSLGNGVRKEDAEIIKRKKMFSKGYYPIEGYDGWYLNFDAFMNIDIYNLDSNLPVCEYTSEVDDNDRYHLAVDDFLCTYREDMYDGKSDELQITDEEEKIINSNDFYTAIDKTIDKMPDRAFNREW